MTTPSQNLGPLDNIALRAELMKQQARNAAMAHDIAMLREANENLLLASVDAQNLRDAAELANTRQNEFLAMLAHELRNPLAPIAMANALMAKLHGASPEMDNLNGIVKRQVAHLTRLLDDLLDAARISSGKVTLLRSRLPLVDLLRRAVQTVQVRMLERSQRIDLVLPDELIIDGDPVRLAQVFSNLLVNASKYTREGGTITLSAAVDGQCAVVTVADNGAGIDADVMPHIFELFTQGPRALARSEGGLGVGLNVVRNIVQLHGGQVTAASPGPGLGSTFCVRLPLSAAAEREQPRAPESNQAVPRRILIVEDNLDANETLRSLLAADGHDVTAAFDGPAGLALARKHVFDVLLCDIGLPGIDGLQLLAQLRATVGAHIPFAVAISGYGRSEDRLRAATAGYGHYLVKPVDVDALLGLISSEVVTRFISTARRPH